MDVYSKARDLGIDLEFVDGQGHRHVVKAERLRAILDGLPSPPRHPYLKQPVVIVADVRRLSRPDRCRGERASAGGSLNVMRCSREDSVAGAMINLPHSMAIGTYRLELEDGNGNTIDSIPLLVTPAAAYQGSFDRRLGTVGSIVRAIVVAQLGNWRFHGSCRADRIDRGLGMRRHRTQSASRAVR